MMHTDFRPAPIFARHTRGVPSGLGYDEQGIDELVSDGVISPVKEDL